MLFLQQRRQIRRIRVRKRVLILKVQFAPVCSLGSSSDFRCLAKPHKSFPIYQMECKMGFLNGPLRKRFTLSAGRVSLDPNHQRKQVTLLGSLYGFKQAPRMHFRVIMTYDIDTREMHLWRDTSSLVDKTCKWMSKKKTKRMHVFSRGQSTWRYLYESLPEGNRFKYLVRRIGYVILTSGTGGSGQKRTA
ncbi:gag-pol polyprotein [Tanacetum coccineum]